MALRTLNPGLYPLGQYDALDTQVTSPLGGEVAGFTYVNIGSATDQAAEDVYDGYLAQAGTRPAATTTLVAGMRPLFLVDEGVNNYGTLLGVVVGAQVGKQSVGGALLGPHTASGSGKWTLWDKEGLYAVTLDAVDTTINSGLVPTNPALVGNDPLYATAAGLLTPNAAVAFEALVVGRLLEFTTDGSLVRTSQYLVSALNSPTGLPASPFSFTHAVFHFRIET